MLDKIVQMIIEEANKRDGENIELKLEIVLFEVIDKISDVIVTIKRDRLNNL